MLTATLSKLFQPFLIIPRHWDLAYSGVPQVEHSRALEAGLSKMESLNGPPLSVTLRGCNSAPAGTVQM